MTHLRSIACSWRAALAAFLLSLPAVGQPAELNQFKPSDIYFQAWLTVREAEKAEDEGKFLEAFNKYDKGKQLFDSVALHHPEWKTDLVKDRQQITAEAMTRIKEEALKEQQKLQKKTEDLVENPAGAPPRTDFEVPQLSETEQQEISKLQDQITRYKNELNKARSDRDANAVRLRNALRELEAQRDRLARAPVTGQLQDLNKRITRIEQERDAMAAALRESRREHQQLEAELATAKADTSAAKEREMELQTAIDVQTTTAKEAVGGLRRQLKELRDALIEKDKRNGALEARNAQLMRQLQEAKAEVLDLREERDSLLAERDQIASLLKLNESERVQLLLKQNMKLGQDLKTARDRLQELHTDNNVAKDQLIEAKRDLAFAKGRIIEFQTQTASQRSRLEELEERLRNAGQELEAGLSQPALQSGNREEMELLRGIISRQLKIQERRKLTMQATMEAINELGLDGSALADSLATLGSQQLTLTDEESQLIKDYRVDQDFIFADPPDQREVLDAKRNLQASIAIKDQLARRAYANERYLAAREVFESILSEDPGNVDTILNLGVVHMKNDELPLARESFSNALVIRGENLPFAHFMLGVCYYRSALRASDDEQSEHMAQAKAALEKSLTQRADNAQAYVYLGSIAGSFNELREAEEHFKAAIRINPTLTEPYYNLAVIYKQRGMKEEAREYYRKALENGADLDLDFEASLSASIR